MAPQLSLSEAYSEWRNSPLGSLTEDLELETMLRLIGSVDRQHILLDIGCGDGTYAIALARLSRHVVALDRSVDMLEAARLRARDCGVRIGFSQADATVLPYSDDTFDLITIVTVLGFVSEPASAIREVARVLRPGGRVVIGELGRFSLWAAWRRLRGLLRPNGWRGVRFYTARALKDMLDDAGLVVLEVAGAVYYPPSYGVARWLARLERRLSRWTTVGAAFVAVSARKS